MDYSPLLPALSEHRDADGGHNALRTEILSDPSAEAVYQDSNIRSRLIWHLSRVRNFRSLSQRVVARRMRTTQSAISDLEKGGTDPRLSTLQKYARAIGCYLRIELVEDVTDDDSSAWRPIVHFTSWRNRTFPYNRQLLKVRVEKEPHKIWGRKFAIEGAEIARWKQPASIRNPMVQRINVSSQPDEYLSSVIRG